MPLVKTVTVQSLTAAAAVAWATASLAASDSTDLAARQVQAAVPVASEHRWLFEDYYRRFREFPIDNEAAGAPPLGQIYNEFIDSVAISSEGISVRFGGRRASRLRGSTLDFVPVVTGPNQLYFECRPTGRAARFFDQRDCAMRDFPPEPVITIRRQVQVALNATATLRWYVERYVDEYGSFPASNVEAGYYPPEQLGAAFVASISVTQNEIAVRFDDEANALLRGKTLRLVGEDLGAAVAWTCTSLDAPNPVIGFVLGTACLTRPAEPDLQLQAARQRIDSAYAVGAFLQHFVEDYFLDTGGQFPDSNIVAGAPEGPFSTRYTTYDNNIGLDDNGRSVINTTLPANAYPTVLASQTVTWHPVIVGSEIVAWECGPGTLASQPQVLPPECRR